MEKPYLVEIEHDPEGGGIVWIPANVEMLKIAQLYLEKYEVLESADRDLFREVLKTFSAGRNAFLNNARLKVG